MSRQDPATDVQYQRACDRCRRKKARCDSANYSCTGCRGVAQTCTFDIPPGKRGPKGKPISHEVASDSSSRRHPVVLSPSSTSASSHPSPVSFSPRTPVPFGVGIPSQHHLTPLTRWRLLDDAVAQATSSSTSLVAVVRECTELFFHYILPLNTSVHEPSFRQMLSQVLDASSLGVPLTESSFTLITAVCAKVCFFVPSDLFPLGSCLAEVFLEASRSCLSSYRDVDVENPCADSITIRLLHSNCLHTCARPKLAWYIFGEAVRLVQYMRLHDEHSYALLPPVEADKRRNAFWHVFIGDKSLAVLRSMPITIQSHSFEDNISTAYPPNDQNEYSLGSNAGIRLWHSAAELLLSIRSVKISQGLRPDLSLPPRLTPADHASLSQLYVRFASCIDDLPAHLLPESIAQSNNNMGTTSQVFATQVADLQVTYHCLKMHLVHRLEETGYFTEHEDMMVLRKTEIARDMVRILQILPFRSLQVSGEPCVEKIRLIGASLLAIIQKTSPLMDRARRDLTILLDILSRLDSRASDSLRQGMS